MTGQLSEDGKWLWNGSKWVPTPPNPPKPPASLETSKEETASESPQYPSSSMNFSDWDHISIEDSVNKSQYDVNFLLFSLMFVSPIAMIFFVETGILEDIWNWIFLGLFVIGTLASIVMIWFVRSNWYIGRMIVAKQGIIFIARLKTRRESMMLLVKIIITKILGRLAGIISLTLTRAPQTAHLNIIDLSNPGSIVIPKEDIYTIGLEDSSFYGRRLIIYLHSGDSYAMKIGRAQMDSGISTEALSEFTTWKKF